MPPRRQGQFHNWNRRFQPGAFAGRALVRAGEPAHGEFDRAVRQLAPAFDRTHVGGLRVAVEEVARLGPRPLARQCKGLAQIAIVGLTPPGHPAGEIPRANGHVENSETDNDQPNIVPGARVCESPAPAAVAGRTSRQFVVLPVLVFGLAGAAVLGVSVLRTLPQGSLEALASGIFFSDSR